MRPDWDNYFIDIALAVSKRATCLRRTYGAVIVKDNIIISTGYNGAAKGYANCNDRGLCYRKEHNIPSGTHYELCQAVHAEANAIINGDPVKMRGATIYIAGYECDSGKVTNSAPCMMCDRMIRNAGISRIVYAQEKTVQLSSETIP